MILKAEKSKGRVSRMFLITLFFSFVFLWVHSCYYSYSCKLRFSRSQPDNLAIAFATAYGRFDVYLSCWWSMGKFDQNIFYCENFELNDPELISIGMRSQAPPVLHVRKGEGISFIYPISFVVILFCFSKFRLYYKSY